MSLGNLWNSETYSKCLNHVLSDETLRETTYMKALDDYFPIRLCVLLLKKVCFLTIICV